MQQFTFESPLFERAFLKFEDGADFKLETCMGHIAVICKDTVPMSYLLYSQDQETEFILFL